MFGLQEDLIIVIATCRCLPPQSNLRAPLWIGSMAARSSSESARTGEQIHGSATAVALDSLDRRFGVLSTPLCLRRVKKEMSWGWGRSSLGEFCSVEERRWSSDQDERHSSFLGSIRPRWTQALAA
jgi:hypothetical protein